MLDSQRDKGNAQITDFRKLGTYANLEKRYYESLDLDDIDENPLEINKTSVTWHEAIEQRGYSILYFNTENLPIRLDRVVDGEVFKEAYLEWYGDRIINIYDFWPGYRFRRTINGETLVQNLYSYEYDIDKKIISKKITSYFAEYQVEYHTKYEHDEKSLARKFERKVFKPVPLWLSRKQGQTVWVLTYDRDHYAAPAESTVSKTPYISVFRRPKNPLLFKRSFDNDKTTQDVPVCEDCGEAMSYLGHFCLADSRIKKKSLLNYIPVFFCFNCQGGNTIDFNAPKFKRVKTDIFPETQMDFISSNDEERQENALIKIGGLPDWIQNEDWPVCQECKTRALFVGQISSSENISNGHKSQVFGDDGKLYVFTCCHKVTIIMQDY